MRTRRTLALLGGGYEQCHAVRVARELGYRTLVVDDDPDAPARALADVFVASRIKDPERLHRDLAAHRFDGVFTHAAELGVEQARVAERFGLPGLSVGSAERGTLKDLRLAALSAAGVAVPPHRVLDAEAPLASWRAAAKELGHPLVAKPIDQKGARGVELVEDERRLSTYYAGTRSRLRSARYVLEVHAPGEQISTESVLLGGEAIWHAFALRHYEGMERFHPYLIEDGHSMPLDLDVGLRSRIEETIVASAAALGVTDGVLKGDLVVAPDGTPVVLEMAIRTSGGRFADLVTPLHCGVNVLYPLIQLAMGDQVDGSRLERRRSVGVSQRFVLLPEGARARGAPRVAARASEDVAAIEFQPRFLRTLRQEPIRSHHDRIGYVVCTGPERDEADARARTLVRAIEGELL